MLVNKIDGIDEEEGDSVEGILREVERRLKNNKLEAQGYIGISAKWAFQGKQENKEKMIKASNIGVFYDAVEKTVLPGREQYKRNSLLDGLVKMIYGIGSRLQDMREKNEAQKDKDYAAYIEMETELATVWDELENIADIMLTEIEQNQPEGRKRLNAAMKSFYGILYWLGIFFERDDNIARKYFEEAAVRGDERAQWVLIKWLLRNKEYEAAEYWMEKMGRSNFAEKMQYYLDKGRECLKENKFDKALKYYRLLAKFGTDVEVMYLYKKIMEGQCVNEIFNMIKTYRMEKERNVEKAKMWLEKRIEECDNEMGRNMKLLEKVKDQVYNIRI